MGHRTGMPVFWRFVSCAAPGRSAAIGVFHVVAPSKNELEGALKVLGVGEVPPGSARLRRFGDFDHGVVARPTKCAAIFTPHAGPAVLRGMSRWFGGAGLVEATTLAPLDEFPEAATVVEARMLAALARAVSPLAIDLLLDQPRRWSMTEPPGEGQDAGSSPRSTGDSILERSRILNRLIDPPVVAALGAPNIGKSALLNALAGRSASLVADEPGTTRDHVGVRLDLAGLVVDYLDTPGMDESSSPGASSPDTTAEARIIAEAQELALHAAERADLVLLCADRATRFLARPSSETAVIRVALRSDLGYPEEPYDLSVSAITGRGIAELVAMIRERLVPQKLFDDPGPWRFWQES